MLDILVCGDAMVDRYYFGEVTRISPEAPVPVAKILTTEERPGGAANVLANVVALGCENASGVFSPSYQTKPVLKCRIIGMNQQLLRMDMDHEQEAIQPAAWIEAKVTIFSDYGKGSLSQIEALIRQTDSIMIVDPRGFDYRRYKGTHIIKPNIFEMKELVGGWATEAQLEEKAQNLREELQLEAILLTRGAGGMTLFDDEGVYRVQSEAHEVYDVSGAGDTAIAAFAVALVRNHTLRQATFYANKAAGIVVGHFGTAVATEKEVFSV